MPKYFTVIFWFFSVFMIQAQADSLRSPLDIPLYLSGTFGELRTNHFHSGLDIKTQGKEGLPVYAVDDGYVYRIKISRNGYGKALYIRHPSGLVSVYGHLKYFNDRIDAYIKQKQYKKQSFEIEVFPYKIELPVKKGEVIGYSGNTGGSFGAHLHFELRNLKEHPLNPMAYGIKVADHKRPVVRSVFAYPLDNSSHVNRSTEPVKLNMSKLNDSVYVCDSILAFGEIGLGINTYDLQDNSYNKNGLYRIKMKVNGLTVYEHVMEEFSFFNSHYINTLIDYPYFQKYRKRIIKLWVEPYNFLEIYTQLVNDGKIEVEHEKHYQIVIELSDFDGNKTYVKVPVYGYYFDHLVPKNPETTPYKVVNGVRSVFNVAGWEVIFLPDTGYFDFYPEITAQEQQIKVSAKGVPLHKAFLIKYPLNRIDSSKRDYVYLAKKGKKNRKYYVYSVRKNDTLTAYPKSFGTYTIAYDSLPPYIKPLNFKPQAKLTDYRFLKFKAGDRQTGLKTYDAYIDGQWILLEYDYKKSLLTYDFSDLKLSGYKHHLKVVVTDYLGNEKVFETDFYRKEKNGSAK